MIFSFATENTENTEKLLLVVVKQVSEKILNFFVYVNMDSRLRGNDSGAASQYVVIPAKAGIHAHSISKFHTEQFV